MIHPPCPGIGTNAYYQVLIRAWGGKALQITHDMSRSSGTSVRVKKSHQHSAWLHRFGFSAPMSRQNNTAPLIPSSPKRLHRALVSVSNQCDEQREQALPASLAACHTTHQEQSLAHWSVFVVFRGQHTKDHTNVSTSRPCKGPMSSRPPNLAMRTLPAQPRRTGAQFHPWSLVTPPIISTRTGRDGQRTMIVHKNTRAIQTTKSSADTPNHLLSKLTCLFPVGSPLTTSH